MTATQSASHPEHVGILAIEAVWPATYVRLDRFQTRAIMDIPPCRCKNPLPSMLHQGELEQHDGVAAGKYTVGLGQVLQDCYPIKPRNCVRPLECWSFALTKLS
jgi:hypothetical protein